MTKLYHSHVSACCQKTRTIPWNRKDLTILWHQRQQRLKHVLAFKITDPHGYTPITAPHSAAGSVYECSNTPQGSVITLTEYESWYRHFSFSLVEVGWRSLLPYSCVGQKQPQVYLTEGHHAHLWSAWEEFQAFRQVQCCTDVFGSRVMGTTKDLSNDLQEKKAELY